MTDRSPEHYSPEQWIDFLRGLAPAAECASMRRHLEQCPECARDALLLENTLQLAAADRAYEPPREVVEAAENIFAPVPPAAVEGLGSRLRRLAGILEWDSFQNAVPGGVRSLRPDARHAIYRAGRYSIDIILDVDAESGAVVLTGQVADDSAPDSPTGVINPVLMAGRDVICGTRSGEWGEFSLQYRTNRDLTLLIPMEASGECIELPLQQGSSSEVKG
jgi:hypothetical protein